MDPEVVVVDFPIREGGNVEGEYERFITELRHKLAHHPARESYIQQHGDWLREHPLLPRQRPIQPARWIHINLILQNEYGVEERRISIAVRDDNVYLMGFSNQHGWYELGIEGQRARFIDGSTFLGFDVGYPDMVGGSANLVSLELTKYDVIRAIRVLSEYQDDAAHHATHGVTKHHLARLCVIICECARMTPHRNSVILRWNTNQSRITLDQAANIKDWKRMSRELLSGPRPQHYLDVVHLVLNVRPRPQQQQDQQGQTAGGGGESSQLGSGSSKTQMSSSGRPTSSSGGSGAQAQKGGKSVRTKPLVEVHSVEAMGDIGSIVVFDGKRGQIIYKNRARSVFSFIWSIWKSSIGTRSGNQRRKDLALTGPYKAISADGCFAIQVRDITSAADESGRVIGEMLWDCYAEDVQYNRFLTGDIVSTGTGTSQHTLGKVFYAVLSDAVEATVEVNLLLPGNTSVYGRIDASYPELQFNEVVLFERGRDEKLELAPSAAGLMVPLELVRSVIVVPFSGRYSRVWIHVRLTAAHTNEERDVSLRGDVTLFLDKHTGEIRVAQYEDRMVPGGWWPAGIPDATGGDGASGSGSGQGNGQTTVQQCKVQLNITSPGFHVSPLKPEF